MSQSKPTDAEIANEIKAIQVQVARLNQDYTPKDRQWRAIELSYQALRVAWYVIARGDDEGTLEDLEAQITLLKRNLNTP